MTQPRAYSEQVCLDQILILPIIGPVFTAAYLNRPRRSLAVFTEATTAVPTDIKQRSVRRLNGVRRELIDFQLIKSL
jgi:hypothetical protein